MICDKCIEGSILPGKPTGSMQYNDTAYYAPAPALPEGTEKTPEHEKLQKSCIIVLTDVFGLPLVNCKLIADRYAKEVGCDAWVPDIFNGAFSFPWSLL